jgi:hypothetical protein
MSDAHAVTAPGVDAAPSAVGLAEPRVAGNNILGLLMLSSLVGCPRGRGRGAQTRLPLTRRTLLSWVTDDGRGRGVRGLHAER